MAFLLKRSAMASKLAARDDNADPSVEVIDAIETRGANDSRIRVRSARSRALELDDEHERPTLVPAEPIDPAALEARVLYESRAVIERRLSLATQQDLQATRRVDAIDLPEREDVEEREQPVVSVEEPFTLRISVDTRELDEAFERRRSRVRAVALTMMLALVIAIAVIALYR